MSDMPEHDDGFVRDDQIGWTGNHYDEIGLKDSERYQAITGQEDHSFSDVSWSSDSVSGDAIFPG